MDELSMMMDFARKIRVIFVGRLQYDLTQVLLSHMQLNWALSIYLWAIGKLMRCQINLPKGALANQPSQRVIANSPQIFRRELSGRK